MASGWRRRVAGWLDGKQWTGRWWRCVGWCLSCGRFGLLRYCGSVAKRQREHERGGSPLLRGGVYDTVCFSAAACCRSHMFTLYAHIWQAILPYMLQGGVQGG